MDGAFDLIGPAEPETPVVVSVPHAGRDYPLALRAMLAVPIAALVALEDRHVDAVARAARGTETMLVQRRARAWIDLNRSEAERDPRIDEGAAAAPARAASARVRTGLGLVPRRAIGTTPLWRSRFADADIAQRIAADHRPYHATLTRLLEAARARFGAAVLVDLHSMPPLASRAGIVVGDRFGRSAGPRFVARAEAAAAQSGTAVALNTPYAGGYVLDRHGRPRDGIHAIQIEIDRALYLDARLDAVGPGVAATARTVRAILAALADEARDTGRHAALPLAAE